MAAASGPGRRARRATATLAALGLAAVACAGPPTPTAAEAGRSAGFHPDGWPGVVDVPRGGEVFNPILAGENLPSGYRQVLQREDILPVYRPTFVTADGVDWPDDELVIGVDLEGEARAYPIGFLNRREIVVDMHRGIPTFVTW